MFSYGIVLLIEPPVGSLKNLTTIAQRLEKCRAGIYGRHLENSERSKPHRWEDKDVENVRVVRSFERKMLYTPHYQKNCRRTRRNRSSCEPYLGQAVVWRALDKANSGVPGIGKLKAGELICDIGRTTKETGKLAPEISRLACE